MNKTRIWLVSLAVICLTVVGGIEIFAKPSAEKTCISIHKVEEQVVLYTIYRGSYDKIGPVIGKLYALAGKNRINPRGSAYYVYLNNPNQVSSEHWLTEVRIPVSKDALKAAGTLGKMTDVKKVPAMEVAIAIKPEGQADPSPIYNALYTWIIKQGYMPAGPASEKFLTNAMTGNYAQMKSEITITIKKLNSQKD